MSQARRNNPIASSPSENANAGDAAPVTKPPRGRLSRAERAMIGGSALLVTVIGGGTWWADRMNNDLPEIVIPKAVMPSPNAFDAYVAATGKIARKSDINDASDQLSGRWKPSAPPRISVGGRMVAATATKPFTPAELSRLVRDNAPALSGVRAGFKQEYRHPRITDYNYLMPYLANFRQMSRVFQVEAKTRANGGDFTGAANSGLDAMRLGVDTPRGGFLICALVGYACEAIGRRTVQQYMGRLTSAECRRAIARLERMDETRTPVADTLREEQYSGLGTLKTLFATKTTAQIVTEFGGPSSGSPSSSGGPLDIGAMMEKLRFQGRMATVSKRSVVENYKKYTDAQIARAAQEPWIHNAKPIPLPDDPISQIVLPVLDGATFSDARTRAQSRLLTATLAVRAYQLDKGAFPPHLDELVRTGYLRRVPDDPFAPAFHTPLRYRVLGGPTMRSYDFIVYSVGPDAKNDNGKPAPSTAPLISANPPSNQTLDQNTTGDLVSSLSVFTR